VVYLNLPEGIHCKVDIPGFKKTEVKGSEKLRMEINVEK